MEGNIFQSLGIKPHDGICGEDKIRFDGFINASVLAVVDVVA